MIDVAEQNTEIEQNADYEQRLQQLVAFLREEEVRANNEWLAEERADALDFYNGKPFGDEEEGRSQVVTRDVAEVIDYTTVSILRTMISGDRVIEFDHPNKQVAEQATAAVMQEFFQGQNGYRVLHDWIKAGLLEKTSVAKVCIERQPPKRVEQTVTAEGFAQLQESGAQIVSAEVKDEFGEQIEVAYLVPHPPRFRDYVVPNEECQIAQDTRDLDEYCPYIDFRQPKTISELAHMGFDTTHIVEDIGYQLSNDILEVSRDEELTQYWRQSFVRSGPNRRVWYHEEYCYYDLNGDGVAELLLTHRVGSNILVYADSGEYAIQEVDEQPGVLWCPFPMQHRIIGQSLADKVMDIQRVRSVLLRQGLDNLYQSNSPRWTLSESSIGDTTLDDLLTVRAGGVIRHVGSQPPVPVALPFAAQSAFEVMQTLAGEKEARTGITRVNQGLDADSLNHTATGAALMQAAGQQMEEYQARNFAEAFAKLALKKYHLMRKYGQPMQLAIDGDIHEIDPRQWPDDMNIQVRVGLGSGRKDQRLAYRSQLLQINAAAVQSGSKVFTDANLYNNLKGFIADAALGNVRELLTDPEQLPPEEPKQDPEMAKAQAEAMIAAEKLDADKAASQADAMLRAQQMELDAQLKQQQLEADLQAKRERASLETELARQKAEFEAQLAQQKADREYALALMKIQHDRELGEMRLGQQGGELPTNRPGGALDE